MRTMLCASRLVAGALAAIVLTACSGPTGLLGSVNFSGQTVPYPENYREIVEMRALAVGETAGMSVPVPGYPASAREAVGWYVCVQRSSGQVAAVYIGEGARVKGIIEEPQHVCGPGTVYQLHTREPY